MLRCGSIRSGARGAAIPSIQTLSQGNMLVKNPQRRQLVLKLHRHHGQQSARCCVLGAASRDREPQAGGAGGEPTRPTAGVSQHQQRWGAAASAADGRQGMQINTIIH
jgi:hypothetical protein